MRGSTPRTATPVHSNAPPNLRLVGVGVLGVAAFVLSLWAIQPLQFRVVSYTAVLFSPAERYWPPRVFAVLVFLAILALVLRAGWSAASYRWRTTATLLGPFLLSAPLACYAFVSRPAPFALTFPMILGAGWAAFRAVTRVAPFEKAMRRAHHVAVGAILVLIVLLTVIHTRIQINFFDHFMLGHADIGHFTEELKNALAGRGLRSDSFDNTRLGWHFVPLMYVLVPGYAFWPSPVFLMACSALLVHVVALPAYYLARRLSGSVGIGFAWALAWCLLPSPSRLIYGNTYGFQWNTVTMAVLALVITAGLTNHWRLCVVMLVLLLLCRETAAGAAFGWGLYVTFFTRRRKLGIGIAAVSVAYLLLCVNVLIPHFAAAGRYERLDLFGELGGSIGDLMLAVFTRPNLFFGRLFRGQGLYFLLMMLVPMALLPLRGWRVTLAALPTLLPLLLLRNGDWLSIKFWHHASVLPFFFFAGIAEMKTLSDHANPAKPLRRSRGHPPVTSRARNRGLAAAAVVCAALGHYLYGFSPIAKVYEVYADTPALHQPDPRLAVVWRLRHEIPHDRSILATERLAAHFTDYKHLFTGRGLRDADYVILDVSDAWDTSGLPQKAAHFDNDRAYRRYGVFGSIVVFERRPDAPSTVVD